LAKYFICHWRAPIQSSTAFLYKSKPAAEYRLQHCSGMCIVL